MEEQKAGSKNKGGRPVKTVKRNQLMAIKCTLSERKVIESRAKSARLTVSEYLRELGLTGKIDMRQKALPAEALLMMAELRHIGANMNQAARKRNSNEELTALERAELSAGSKRVYTLADELKNYLQ
jgi:hypothetical protein